MRYRSRVYLFALALAGCGDDDSDVRTIGADAEASTGITTEDPWQPVSMCVAPSLDAAGATTRREEFRKDGRFGNSRWGAGYRLDVSVQADEVLGRRSSETRAEAGIAATVFERELELAKVVVSASARDGEDSRFTCDLNFLNKFVYPVFEARGVFSTSVDHTQQIFEVVESHELEAGLVISLELEGWVTLGFSITGQAHSLGLLGTVTPHAGTVVAGGVSIGDASGVIRAGLEGSVELLDLRAPLEAGLMLDPAPGALTLAWYTSSKLEHRWLSGRIVAYAELASESIEKVLAEWGGYGSSITLGSGRGSLSVGSSTSECSAVESSGGSNLQSTTPLGAFSGDGLPRSTPRLEALLPFLTATAAPNERGEALSILKRSIRDRQVPEVELRASFSGDAASFVAAALGAEGSASSLSLLADVAREPSHSDETRIAAVAAMGLSPRVNAESVEALRQVADAASGALSEATIYALGNAASTLRTAEPALTDAVLLQLADRRRLARTDQERSIAIRAISNLTTTAAPRLSVRPSVSR